MTALNEESRLTSRTLACDTNQSGVDIPCHPFPSPRFTPEQILAIDAVVRELRRRGRRTSAAGDGLPLLVLEPAA